MQDYQDDWDEIADRDEALYDALSGMDLEDQLAYAMKDCDCGGCCFCLGISDKDFM